MIFNKMAADDFEQLVFCQDSKTGLKSIIAIHSTALGPAVGGCRMWNYTSEQEGLIDALRLSKGMTYKAAISGLNWGGGKAVIFGDAKTQKTPELLERFGEFVESLHGSYITAKDVGIGAEDLKKIKHKTQHILGIEGENDKLSSGDPSPATAWGVYHGMMACAKVAFNSKNLKGLTVALQGLGSVSYYLLEHLIEAGAKVIGCDVDPAMVDRAVKKYKIGVVSPDAIYDTTCDIFAPSALGASIQPSTIDRLRCKIVAGAANNQLATNEDGFSLMRKGIIYAPDYVINAGGLTNIYYETPTGYSKEKAFDHIAKIEKTMTDILERSIAEKLPTHLIADQIVEERLAAAKNKKKFK